FNIIFFPVVHIMLSTQAKLIYITCKYFGKYFYGNILLCILKLVYMNLTALMFYACVFTLSNTFYLSISISIIGSLINFKRLAQADQMLQRHPNPEKLFQKCNISRKLAAFHW